MDTHAFKGQVRKHPGKGGWHYFLLDEKTAQKIRAVKTNKVGWGYIPIKAPLGASTWSTTLFPAKEKTFMLAINDAVRKKEDVAVDDILKISLTLR